jgi:hypothetical protein
VDKGQGTAGQAESKRARKNNKKKINDPVHIACSPKPMHNQAISTHFAISPLMVFSCRSLVCGRRPHPPENANCNPARPCPCSPGSACKLGMPEQQTMGLPTQSDEIMACFRFCIPGCCASVDSACVWAKVTVRWNHVSFPALRMTRRDFHHPRSPCSRSQNDAKKEKSSSDDIWQICPPFPHG